MNTRNGLMKNLPFKTCTVCKKEWKSRRNFLDDPNVIIVGYQPHFDTLTEGLFLFNHSCRGTMSIQAGAFRDLYNGPVFQNRLTGTDSCPGYCLHKNELKPCPSQCECAYVREIIQVIRRKN